jgi:predicted transcriptional regulator
MNQTADKSNRSVISVHTQPETAQRLTELAAATRRSKSFLANAAIERYLQEEEAFVAAVKRGQADIKAGRVYSTAEVHNRLRAVIDRSSAEPVRP